MMKQKIDERNLVYWFDYIFDLGTEELMATQFMGKNSMFVFDLDIHIAFVALLAGLGYLGYKVAGVLLAYCKK